MNATLMLVLIGLPTLAVAALLSALAVVANSPRSSSTWTRDPAGKRPTTFNEW